MQRTYPRRVLFAFSRFLNTVVNGDVEESLCSHVVRKADAGSLGAKVAEVVINCLLFPFDGWGHCRKD
jgi:hypothetical protein